MTTQRFLISLAVATAFVVVGWGLLWWSGFRTAPPSPSAAPMNYFVEEEMPSEILSIPPDEEVVE